MIARKSVLFAPLLALFLMMGALGPAIAVTPEEQLSDPLLEQRARDLSAQLRCLVCQNQSIDDSDAALAQDLRREVRVQLSSGLDDAMILGNLQRIYGDYILLNPPVSAATYLLWGSPFVMVLLAGGLFWQSRRRIPPEEDASEDTSKDTSEGVPDRQSGQQSVPHKDSGTPSTAKLSPFIIGGVLCAIFIITGLLYAKLGSPELQAQPAQARQAERRAATAEQNAQTAALQNNLAQAQAQAQERPQSVEARLSLALAYAQLDDFQSEIVALRGAVLLSEGAPVIKAMLAEALSRQADGQITLPARALIQEVLQIVPTEPRALFMAGLAAYQDEAYQSAIDIWSQLQTTAPAGSPWPALAARNIATAAERGGIAFDDGGPDSDLVAAIASASQEDQQEMIVNMVQSLEERLAQAPDDSQGWQRLIQARRVLEDEAGLLRALSGAAQALPDSRDAQLDLLEFILVTTSDEAGLAAGDRALARLAAQDDQALEYLFFAGHMARLRGQFEQAITHWEALYARLEEDGAFKAQLAKQIAELKQDR